MRHLRATFAMSSLTLILSVPVIAGEDPTVYALEHAAKAQAHGDDGRTKEMLEHAEESLRHARAAEKVHAEQRGHMSEAVKHLEQAIEHGKAGHSRVANKHVHDGLTEIRKSASPD